MSRSTSQSIIKEAMASENIIARRIPYEKPFTNPDAAQRSRRYFEVRGFAWFVCEQKHRWSSVYSWCFIDLKRQKICYRDTQQCKECDAEAKPWFPDDSLTRMAEFVVYKYCKLMHLPSSKVVNELTAGKRSGSHYEEGCGRCKRRGQSCTQKKN